MDPMAVQRHALGSREDPLVLLKVPSGIGSDGPGGMGRNRDIPGHRVPIERHFARQIQECGVVHLEEERVADGPARDDDVGPCFVRMGRSFPPSLDLCQLESLSVDGRFQIVPL